MTNIIFIIYCNFISFSVFAYNVINQSSKLDYIENLQILKMALKNQDTLDRHLHKYSIDAQELETGDTALHFLSDQIESIHNTITSYVSNEIGHFEVNNHYLNKKYKDRQKLLEYIIIQGASPYITNRKGERVIEAKGFSLYLSSVLETYKPDLDRKIYKVYLAGPEVFLPFYEKVSHFLEAQVLLFNKYHLKEADYHMQGFLPENENELNSYDEYFKWGTTIHRKNRALMHSYNAVIANMTIHYESSMDVGTAYQMGEMIKDNKPVIGYYNTHIYNLQYDKFMEDEIVGDPAKLIYTEEYNPYRELKIPDNLMVFISTLSSQGQKVEIPSSSWEALFILKSKFSSYNQENE